MTVSELRDVICNRYGSLYRLNDLAHRIGHFNAVEVCGTEINNRLDLGYDPKMIMLVSYFHDMFAFSRFNHHILSSTWVRTTDEPIITELEPHIREMVAHACKEHRASFKGDFSSFFAELMNSADREMPGNVGNMLERAIQFRLQDGCHDDDAESRARVLPDAVAHIKDKFGSDGYARYPEMYMHCFAEELEQQRQDIKNL